MRESASRIIKNGGDVNAELPKLYPGASPELIRVMIKSARFRLDAEYLDGIAARLLENLPGTEAAVIETVERIARDMSKCGNEGTHHD